MSWQPCDDPVPGDERSCDAIETIIAPRYIWWNFVSSSKERIEQAKAGWKAGRFDSVPGESEFIPLPGR